MSAARTRPTHETGDKYNHGDSGDSDHPDNKRYCLLGKLYVQRTVQSKSRFQFTSPTLGGRRCSGYLHFTDEKGKENLQRGYVTCLRECC